MINNSDKVILDLAGGTGAWSYFYKFNGYTVYVITLPYYDLLDEDIVRFCINLNPYGILFACPCDIWSIAGGRFWETRTPDEVLMHSKILVHGLRIIYNTNPVFWVLENPIGKMKEFMGEPAYKFDPFNFGDAYTKRTYLWGKFNIPMFPLGVEPKLINPTKHVNKRQTPISWISGKNRKEKRSITPPGFAQAFFEANK